MAIYHLSAQALSRSSGASAVAAAAYRAGDALTDERTGERHNYSRRTGVDAAEIIAPDQAPDWVQDRAKLWNAAEAAERRRDSQVAREVRVALPAELEAQERRDLVREFCRQEFADRGMVADVAYHDSAGENPHAHILLTMRRIEGEGFGKKERAWNAKDQLEAWREGWSDHANGALARAGQSERIDHRTLEEQRKNALERGDLEAADRLNREPQIHLGKAAYMEAKGIETDRGSRSLEIAKHNDLHSGLREWAWEQIKEFGSQLQKLFRQEALQPSQGEDLPEKKPDRNTCHSWG